ncbi:MAG TPA: hypothetical protein ENJ09_12080 [Planctomycetes bacterium]|nr:hypothetical protein [Planctomycetota bacterium]
MRSPAVVLLAAGASRRLGTAKALVRLRDEHPASPLELLLSASRCVDEHPLVVAGEDAGRIRSALAGDPRVELLEHPLWHQGRAGSVRAAARARPGRDLLIAPVDVPLVPAAVFEALARRWRDEGAPPRGWLAPRVLDQRGELRHGHPVLLGRALCSELEDTPADLPLRELRSDANPLLAVDVEAIEILDDLDTPADLERLRTRLRRRDRP